MTSPIARFAKFLRGGEDAAAVEILPPGQDVAPRQGENQSVEARAGAFAALFLDNAPKDLRGDRPGPR
jgi:hypothetical protein